jgi:PKD repeat protein
MEQRKTFLCVSALVLLLVLVFPVAGISSTSESGYITVGLAPVANFNARYSYNTVPATVAFQDLSTGTTPMTYLWEFGDGATSTEQNPSHTYIRQGLYTVKLTVTNSYGASSETKTSFIAIGLGPGADFTGQPTTGNTPLTVAFTDRSTGNPTMWYWNFGDGKESSEQNPVHTYFSNGEFTVTLTATNDYGSSYASKPYFIHTIPVLRSKFIADPKSGKAPLLVKFTDKSTGNPKTWTWDFGDGATSTQPNPIHSYNNPGVFDVNLTVTNDMNKDTSVQTIVVGGVPFTDFAADRTTVAEKTPVLFTDQTLNSPIKWSWDFGDGSTSTTQNPSHSYLLKGIYTVTLTTTNKNGEDTEKKVNYITVGVVPVADFITEIPSYQQGTRMQYVRFIDTSAGNPTSWYWDFGDGQNSSEQFPPLHLYNKDGTYTVSLTVKNVFGENTRIKTNLITVREGPRVDFTADRTRPSVNQFVHFTDLSTGTPTSWNWDFGDGSSATGQTPDHAYRQPGVYSVKLTVSDAYTSISHTKRNYITVVITPHADFSADKTKGITPFTVKFTDLSTGSPTGWNWDFGDGATSREQNPTHIYTTSVGSSTSRYTVTLIATNANGSDEDKKFDYITVTQTPIAEFTVDNRQGKAPFIVKFRDLSAGNPTKWLWEFGDGSASSEQNPTHMYPFEGSYDVRLSVSNQFGTDTIFKTGTTSQRGNTAPVPLITSATLQPTTSPSTEVTAIVPTASTTKPSTTMAPVSLMVPIVAAVVGLLAIIVVKQK